MKKRILIAIMVLLSAAAIGIYVFDLIANGTEPTKYLFRLIASLCICIGSIFRIAGAPGSSGRDSLMRYELEYKKELGSAFSADPRLKKRLLVAIRAYNRNEFIKAVKLLGNLKPHCETRDDIYAVGLFLAESLDGLEAHDAAIKTYEEMISLGITSSQIYSNLGFIYSRSNDDKSALSYLKLAVQSDPDNLYANNNLAFYYYRRNEYDEAIRYAKRALEINGAFSNSAALLAIIYSIREETELADKYKRIAASSGYDLSIIERTVNNHKFVQDDEYLEDEEPLDE